MMGPTARLDRICGILLDSDWEVTKDLRRDLRKIIRDYPFGTYLGSGVQGVVVQAGPKQVAKFCNDKHEFEFAQWLRDHPTQYFPRVDYTWELPSKQNGRFLIIREALEDIYPHVKKDESWSSFQNYLYELSEQKRARRLPPAQTRWEEKARNIFKWCRRRDVSLIDVHYENLGVRKIGRGYQLVVRDFGFCDSKGYWDPAKDEG